MDEIMSGVPIFGALRMLDIIILVASLVLLFVIAYFAGRRETGTADFFTANRQVPLVIATFSFVATEVSAVTITNVPGTGMTESLYYLQFFIGSAASKIFVAFLFIPVFYRHNCTSIYEFLRHRFGPPTQYAGSAFFFVTRLLASGVRLAAACTAIAIILDWTVLQALLLFSLASIAFITFGGIKAVVYTGAYQAAMFYAAGLAVLGWLFFHIHGGFGAIWQIAGEAGKLRIFDFSPSLSSESTFWMGTANAFFIGLAIFGTDQELVQRLLTVDSRRSSQKAILATIVAAFPVTFIYLTIGTLMFVFFHQAGGAPAGLLPKQQFPNLISTVLPVGMKGLVLAAIILASIDSPLASLASSFVQDIYRPLIRRKGTDRHYLLVSRLGVVGFGVVLGLIALACGSVGNLLWFAFQIISVTGGALLGVFLLGILTRRGTNRGNIAAMLISSLAMVVLLFLCNYGPVGLMRFFSLTSQVVPPEESKIIPLAWGWSIVIGTLLTFALGLVLGWRRHLESTPQPEMVEAETIAN